MILVRTGYGQAPADTTRKTVVDATKRPKAGSQISGVRAKVVDPSGNGIAGASAQLRPAGSMGTLFSTKTATTDLGGNFVIWATAGTYDLVVSAPGYQTFNLTGVVVPQQGFATVSLIQLSLPAPAAPSDAAGDGEAATDLAPPANGNGSAPAVTPAAVPWYKRWWVWAVAGGALVVLIGGVVLATRRKKESR